MGFDAGDSNLYRYVNNRPTDVADPSGNELLVLGDVAKDQLLKVLTKFGIPFSESKLLPGRYGGVLNKGAIGADKVYQIVSTEDPFNLDVVARIRANGGEAVHIRMYEALTKPGKNVFANRNENGDRLLSTFDPFGDLTPDQRTKILDNNILVLGSPEATKRISNDMGTPTRLSGDWEVSICVSLETEVVYGHAFIKFTRNSNTYFAESQPGIGARFGPTLSSMDNLEKVVAIRTRTVRDPRVRLDYGWTLGTNCAYFAFQAWRDITGERLSLSLALEPVLLAGIIGKRNDLDPVMGGVIDGRRVP